jgi:hypothetical protein
VYYEKALLRVEAETILATSFKNEDELVDVGL